VFHVAPLARAAARPADERGRGREGRGGGRVLTEVEESENKADAIEIDDDVEIDAVEADEDTFLEQEEGEDDDVAALIDGDIDRPKEI